MSADAPGEARASIHLAEHSRPMQRASSGRHQFSPEGEQRRKIEREYRLLLRRSANPHSGLLSRYRLRFTGRGVIRTVGEFDVAIFPDNAIDEHREPRGKARRGKPLALSLAQRDN